MTDTDADKAVAAKTLENLKAKAAQLNVNYHPNIGATKLAEKIKEAMTEEVPTTPQVNAPMPITNGETPQQKIIRKRREASRLVRVRVTCMNPQKREWEGEIFTVSNSLIGTFKKFVPFDNDVGWHVPQIILNMIRERKCQIFVNKKGKGRGKEGKLIREFAIEVMTPLTAEELQDLAVQQSISNSIDK